MTRTTHRIFARQCHKEDPFSFPTAAPLFQTFQISIDANIAPLKSSLLHFGFHSEERQKIRSNIDSWLWRFPFFKTIISFPQSLLYDTTKDSMKRYRATLKCIILKTNIVNMIICTLTTCFLTIEIFHLRKIYFTPSLNENKQLDERVSRFFQTESR